MSAVKMLSDDLAELSLDRVDKEISTHLKSDEELDKLTVDPHLTGIERAVYLLSSGQEVQRVSVITELPNLLRDNNAECMKRVVPKVREVLHVADLEMQLAASKSFLQILEKKLVSLDDYKRTFLQTILSSVDNKNEDIASAWLDTLLCAIDLLPKEIVKKDILSIAVNKGQLSQTLQARLSCCKILGKISSKFENFVVKNEVLPVVSALCGDVEYEVRACMCHRLDVVAHGLGLELTKSQLLPQLIELSEDESHHVICACLETTTSIIEMLDREANVNAILPMVRSLCEGAVSHSQLTQSVTSKLLGRICFNLQDYMSAEDKSYFLEFYKKLCHIGVSDRKHREENTLKSFASFEVLESVPDANTETRRNAAFNFPAMVLFVGAKHFRSELYVSFKELCRDPDVLVRRTIAAGFHEVAKLLGNNVIIIFSELNYLLSDTDIKVLEAIVPFFKDIMLLLSTTGVENYSDNKAHEVQDVVSNFIQCETLIFNSPSWRTQESMVRSMECLYTLSTSDFIFNKVLPLLLRRVKSGRALPVKLAIMKTIAILSRHLKYRNQRQNIINTIIEDFRGSSSCYHRCLFVDFAQFYLNVNSKQAFKSNFYECILNMKSDPVSAVRLKMLKNLPDMKRCLKLPGDQPLRTALDTVLRQITVYDKDPDVQSAAIQMSEELSMIHEGNDNSRTNRRNLSKEEEEDLRREDEENEILAKEEKERKEDEIRLLKAEKKNSVTSLKKESKIPGAKKVPVNKASSTSIANHTAKRASVAGQAASLSASKGSSSVVNVRKGSPGTIRKSSLTQPTIASTGGAASVPGVRKVSTSSTSNTSIARRSSIGDPPTKPKSTSSGLKPSAPGQAARSKKSAK